MLKGSIFGFHIRRCNELRRIGKHQIMLLCGVGPDLALQPFLEACLFLLLQQSIWHPWRAVDVELIWKEWVFSSPSQLLLPWPNLAIWHLFDHLRSVFTPPVYFGAPHSYFLACCCIVYGTHAESQRPTALIFGCMTGGRFGTSTIFRSAFTPPVYILVLHKNLKIMIDIWIAGLPGENWNVHNGIKLPALVPDLCYCPPLQSKTLAQLFWLPITCRPLFFAAQLVIWEESYNDRSTGEHFHLKNKQVSWYRWDKRSCVYHSQFHQD